MEFYIQLCNFSAIACGKIAILGVVLGLYTRGGGQPSKSVFFVNIWGVVLGLYWLRKEP